MTATTFAKIPGHLRKYVVDQNYGHYTPEDQAVWRYIMRQLKSYLAENAHPCYLDGLKKTGISIDRIPEISSIDEHLESFGWGAVPVSGFIPPAAFMEFQSLGILPIASDMRTLEHLLYTPAPDIVHEAAGHAPILAHPEYASYLLQYGEVARHAIIHREDLEQYEAIRKLSDIKEDPRSSAAEIAAAESHLIEVNAAMGSASEAALLSRMNWWTAEYGLIGGLDRPKIFGAGLLSSIGESRSCLRPQVKKIPLTVDCVEFAYNITEPQPQLFVAESFGHLAQVLGELKARMAYRRGGAYGLECARVAKSVNTVELNSGLQMSGVLSRYDKDSNGTPVFVKFDGPCQLADGGCEIDRQGTTRHAHGFSSPLGRLKKAERCLSTFSAADLEKIGLNRGEKTRIEFESGISVDGRLASWTYAKGRLLILTWQECTVKMGEHLLFAPAWGEFDMAVGTGVRSVFGGPADRERFGETEDFVAERVQAKNYAARDRDRHSLFERLRDLREKSIDRGHSGQGLVEFRDLASTIAAGEPGDWLPTLELLEISHLMGLQKEERSRLEERLQPEGYSSPAVRDCVASGLALATKA